MQSNLRILAAEIVGTCVLVLAGVGSAVLASKSISGALGVALAFGFGFLAMAYVLGHVSGCHLNPAVTVAMWLGRKVKAVTVPFFIVGQLVGAAAASLIIYAIASSLDGFSANNFAQNGWGDFEPRRLRVRGDGRGGDRLHGAPRSSSCSRRRCATCSPPLGGAAVGLTLAFINLVTIPVDNTSLNPVAAWPRRCSPAPTCGSSCRAFILFPLIGAVLGVVVWLFVHETRLEDTLLANRRLEQFRDAASGVATKAADAVEDRMD